MKVIYNFVYRLFLALLSWLPIPYAQIYHFNETGTILTGNISGGLLQSCVRWLFNLNLHTHPYKYVLLLVLQYITKWKNQKNAERTKNWKKQWALKKLSRVRFFSGFFRTQEGISGMSCELCNNTNKRNKGFWEEERE